MPRVSDAYRNDKRQQIVAAATRLFAEQGFSRTSMADVVAASGLSTGSVYRYFASRSDLVLAVAAGRDGSLDSALPTESGRDLLARLGNYVAPEVGSEHARLVAQVWGDAAVAPALANAVRTRHIALEERLAARLAAPGTLAGGDDHSTAQVALAALIGLAALVAADIPVEYEEFMQVLDRLMPET